MNEISKYAPTNPSPLGEVGRGVAAAAIIIIRVKRVT